MSHTDRGRVIAQQWISADGFASGEPDETEIFAAIPDAGDSERHNLELLADIDVALLGRRTYERFVQFWPTATDQPMAPLVNRIPKVVFSTTLAQAPWGEHHPVSVVSDAAAYLRDHRSRPGGQALLWGSLELMRFLLPLGLIDELELFIAPIALGRGTALISPDRPVPLTLVDGDIWPSGTARLRYRVDVVASHQAPS